MSSVLYYSNMCEHSKELLRTVQTTGVSDSGMHFVCVDNRVRGPDGAIYVVLRDGSTKVLLPPTVTKVPALLLLDRGHHVLFGSDIINHISPRIEQKQMAAVPVQASGEPQAFALSGAGGFGVASDTYSFLDQSSDDLSAKGQGGMRQQHHYVGIDSVDAIATPPDEYAPDTIGQVSLEQLRQDRDKDVQIKR